MRDVLALILGGGRVPALPAHRASLQAGRADWRKISPHRHPDQQLPSRGHPPHLRPDAVQLGVAQPAHRADLSDGSFQSGVRRDPRRRADAGQPELVSGDGRRRAAGRAAFRQIRGIALPDSGRAIISTEWTTARWSRRTSVARPTSRSRRTRSRSRTRRRWASSGSTGAAGSWRSRRSRERSGFARSARAFRLASSRGAHSPEKPFVASMGVYVFSRDVLLDLLAASSGTTTSGARSSPPRSAATG